MARNGSRTVGLIGCGAVAAMSSGCWFQGGPLVSEDRYTYDSTPMSPKTITIFDLRTDEAVWAYDLPVGRRLIMKFKEGEGPDDYFSSEMQWDDIPAFTRLAVPQERHPVPPYYSRRVEMTLRPVPEMASSVPPEGEEDEGMLAASAEDAAEE
ncbi:MAG: hypothetical protein AAGI30_12990 [Planctomycetota bacterium]